MDDDCAIADALRLSTCLFLLAAWQNSSLTDPTGCHSRPSPGGSATPALLMSNLHAQPFRCLSLFSLLCHHLLQLPELFCPPHTTNHLTLNEPEQSEEHPQRRSTQPARWLADLRAPHLIHSPRDPGKFLYLRTESQSLPVLRIPAPPRLRRRSLLSILYLLSLT